MKTGDYLDNAPAQMAYISTNYTYVARDMAVQGMNVVAQAVGAKGSEGGWRLSLSSNPDITEEVIECVRATGQTVMAVGVVNKQMPFMPNGAEVSPDFLMWWSPIRWALMTFCPTEQQGERG